MTLIVDDSPENIFTLKTLLELNAYPTDTASSGEEALKKILRKTYALIIMDVQMPGMDGFEVAETISGYSGASDTPIIFLSAINTDKKFITKGYNSGGIDYVTKPIDPDILLLKVKTFHKLYEQKRALQDVQDSLKKEIEFRKNAQVETQEKARELHSILESIPQIAFTARADGHIDFVNQQWFEYAADAKAFPAAHPDDPDLNETWKKALGLKIPLELEVRLKKINQNLYRCHLLRALPVLEDGSIVRWVGTLTDIEEQKEVSQQKDEFMSITSHELKTPLASIKAYVQLLERSMDAGDNKKAYIDRTLLQINKLNGLITDLLDVSKIEGGKMKFNKRCFDFNQMLTNATEMMRETYPEYTISKKGPEQLEIYGDELRLEQVVVNYLTNAIKYSPDHKHIEVTTALSDDILTLAVEDHGIGISKKSQQDIFRKFYRVEDDSHRFQGLGIGLYICAEIIKRHDGQYWMKSEPGKGSTFYFSIPADLKN